MIKSFASKETKAIVHRNPVKKLPNDIQKVALRKLRMLDAATSLEDLRIPPANRLEKLKGNRQGQCSIRVNDPWRICFRFHQSDATEVEIADYH